ncbi:hypothetical protein NHH88_04200 [Oxalobacteraceae bacterium OTU3CAMAD1]|nr:hypothetical protein NHH88_04200 [Oxalobacteraceae bacterium OTU3CAMAD1]
MDEQIAELDRRLILVAREHYAIKEDFARLEGRVAVIQANYATKEDIANLYTKMTALDSRFSQVETRMMRWCVGTMITLTGVFMAFVRFSL